MSAPPIHLLPTAPLAPRVLLPGDPGRALAMAQALLEEPRMFNHNRGLWGYTGTAADGQPLSIQSTGMGGPSAAIVLGELIGLGIRHAVRVGTCGGLDPAAELGDLIVAREAIAADGTSRALGAGPSVSGDRALTEALERAAGEAGPRVHAGTIATTDLFYEPDARRPREWMAAGALAVEMEAATLFTLGERWGVAVGCVLVVSDVGVTGAEVGVTGAEVGVTGAEVGVAGEREPARIDDDALARAGELMGAVAARALGA